MQRRTSFSILAIAAIALVASFVATTGNAVAQQNPYCCNYSIDVAGISAGCFPLTVITDWGFGIQDTVIVTGNGVHFGAIPNCPPFPALTFNFAQVNVPPTCDRDFAPRATTSCCVQVIIRP